MNCPSCGYYIRCPRCEGNICPNCGEELDNSSNFNRNENVTDEMNKYLNELFRKSNNLRGEKYGRFCEISDT
jgi:hypothetical protein